MKSKVIIIGSILLSIVLIVALLKHNTKTKKYLEYGDDLRVAIEEFEENRQEFTGDLSTITKVTSEDLNNGNKPAGVVAENWELKWEELNDKLEVLKDDFVEVGESSSSYFLNLENLANEIRDEEMKREEIKKNAELKEQWTRAYKDAARSIQRIEEVIYEGNDFYKVLIISTIRQQVKDDIKELESITIRALALLESLEEFATESKKLISNTNS